MRALRELARKILEGHECSVYQGGPRQETVRLRRRKSTPIRHFVFANNQLLSLPFSDAVADSLLITEAVARSSKSSSTAIHRINMSATPSSLRQRGGPKTKATAPGTPTNEEHQTNGIVDTIKRAPPAISSAWDFKLALAVITVIAFITRFWGIGHPNEVVFDEVHFGKVGIISNILHNCILTSRVHLSILQNKG